MSALSFIFYLLAHHPLMLLHIVPLLFLAAGGVMKLVKRKAGIAWGALPAAVILGFNVICGHWLNAAFLHAVGVDGQAVIVASRQTSSQLNAQWVWAYDVVVTTQDGREVRTGFTTMTASIWPLRNEILIPREGEVFKVRYVPDFERNIVIMTDEARYARLQKLPEWQAPVERAGERFRADSDNPELLRQYIDSLKSFLKDHADVDPQVTANYRSYLASMETLSSLQATAASLDPSDQPVKP